MINEAIVERSKPGLCQGACISLICLFVFGIYLTVNIAEWNKFVSESKFGAGLYLAIMIIYGIIFLINLITLLAGNVSLLRASGCMLCLTSVSMLVVGSIGVNQQNNKLSYLGRNEGRDRGQFGDFIAVYSWIIVGTWICCGSCLCCCLFAFCIAICQGATNMDDAQKLALAQLAGDVQQAAEEA